MSAPALVSIPSATRHLGEVRRFVAEQAAAAGLSEAAVAEVQLAVDEACTNAIEHAYGGRGDHTVEVEVVAEPGAVVVTVRHRGLPFDPEAYHPVGLKRAVQERRSGGFGVQLMRRLMDEVEYRRRGDASEVRLTKRLEAA